MATANATGGDASRARLLAPLQVLLTLLLFAEVIAILGAALFPAVALVEWAEARLPPAGAAHALGLAVALAAAWFVFGLALLVVLPVARWITFARGTPVGRFAYLSMGAWRWASYNALTLVLRFTFVNWIRVTPFLPLYHRLMGARIGRRVQINTAVVADQNLIEIGDDTVIGGDVTLVCHSAERGKLVTAPVRIGSRVTIGLMAVVFPGCVIGDDAIIAAGSVLSKGARVGPGEIWAGVPARRVGRRRSRRQGTDRSTVPARDA
ncbi:MAG TPA: DapH/DapD/GlmU-related protein [Anaeromyxobacter sp.]|nr:DapH/DapD/GlmU-related protein [Anaeromyxobacter sp.]